MLVSQWDWNQVQWGSNFHICQLSLHPLPPSPESRTPPWDHLLRAAGGVLLRYIKIRSDHWCGLASPSHWIRCKLVWMEYPGMSGPSWVGAASNWHFLPWFTWTCTTRPSTSQLMSHHPPLRTLWGRKMLCVLLTCLLSSLSCSWTLSSVPLQSGSAMHFSSGEWNMSGGDIHHLQAWPPECTRSFSSLLLAATGRYGGQFQGDPRARIPNLWDLMSDDLR